MRIARVCVIAIVFVVACGERAPSRTSTPPRAEPAAATPGRPTALRVLTYNVLVDQDRAEERGAALLSVIEGAEADVVVLQETAPWVLVAIAGAEGLRARFAHGTPLLGTGAPGGVYVMSRFPIVGSRNTRLAGVQERRVLVTKIDLGGLVVAIANVHLESPLESGAVRAEQIAQVRAELAGEAHAIFAGDFNFGDGEQPDTEALGTDFVDAWLALHAHEPGYTWNIEASEMARVGSFPGERSRRLDRVLVRSTRLRPRAARIVGDTPVRAGDRTLFPSDHFGLVVDLDVAPPP